jgi:hypothetical protein
MLNRFLSSDVGREILARSTSLEIRMQRFGKKLHASYKLRGCVGQDPFSDTDDDDDEDDPLGAVMVDRREAEQKARDAKDMAFIVDLMRQFEKVER